MTDAPIAQTIHSGGGSPAEWRRGLIALWLAAHGVNADQVSADDPITVLTVPIPFRPDGAHGEGPWLIQVIAFSQYFTNADGKRELNLITRKPVVFQRTVPLHTPFPTDPTTDGGDRGQDDREEAQQAAEPEEDRQEEVGGAR